MTYFRQEQSQVFCDICTCLKKKQEYLFCTKFLVLVKKLYGFVFYQVRAISFAVNFPLLNSSIIK